MKQNPLYGIGWLQPAYFSFQNLIKQAYADNVSTLYNPCNASVTISVGNSNLSLPSCAGNWLEAWCWQRESKKFAANTTRCCAGWFRSIRSYRQPFRGNCRFGKLLVQRRQVSGNSNFKDTYFQADYGGTWLKNFTIQYTDQVQTVTEFFHRLGSYRLRYAKPNGWKFVLCWSWNFKHKKNCLWRQSTADRKDEF